MMTLNKKTVKTERFFYFFIFLAMVISVVWASWLTKLDETKEFAVKIQEEKNYFKNLDIEAKSVFIWDVFNQKPVFSLNEEVQLPLASITKLMTAYVAMETAPKTTIITIKPENIQQEGDSGLFLGEKWRLGEIIKFTLLSSSNDGANAIATVFRSQKEIADKENLFLRKMNEMASHFKLTQSYFLNESGLDLNERISGSYGSAKDVAFLMEKIVEKYPEITEATSYNELNLLSLSETHTAKNTNKKIGVLPCVVASKTGFTDLAGGNLVVMFEAGPSRPFVVSVLGSSVDGRYIDVEKLIWATIKEITK